MNLQFLRTEFKFIKLEISCKEFHTHMPNFKFLSQTVWSGEILRRNNDTCLHNICKHFATVPLCYVTKVDVFTIVTVKTSLFVPQTINATRSASGGHMPTLIKFSHNSKNIGHHVINAHPVLRIQLRLCHIPI